MKQARKQTRAQKAVQSGAPLRSCRTCVHVERDAIGTPCERCLGLDPDFSGALPMWEPQQIVNPPGFAGVVKWRAPQRDKF